MQGELHTNLGEGRGSKSPVVLIETPKFKKNLNASQRGGDSELRWCACASSQSGVDAELIMRTWSEMEMWTMPARWVLNWLARQSRENGWARWDG